MSIFDYIEEARHEKARKQNFNALEEAAEIYDKQKKSLSAITGTQGFKEILGYWKREKELYEAQLVSSGGDKDKLIEGFKIAKRFVDFLENITK